VEFDIADLRAQKTKVQATVPFDEEVSLFRILDAAGNRASEGLRVIEDYVRFALDDRQLTMQLKSLRHRLTQSLAAFATNDRLAARDTLADVGTMTKTESEFVRTNMAAVVTASFQRLQQALRTLEEFSKVKNPSQAAELERLRYLTYTLERAVHTTSSSLERLAQAKLYVLLDGRENEHTFRSVAESLVAAGVHVVQLRDKTLDDRTLLGRARLLRAVTAPTSTLFIMNDRPDLAVLADADGVHVGQEELNVKDARTIAGTKRLMGVSTHNLAQARQAVLDGADYIGVGPAFPSQTKQFADFPGLKLMQAVSAEIRLPAFLIGGITLANLEQAMAAGAQRVAVGTAVIAAGDVAQAAGAFLACLSSKSS
jgi:thiamine-phosphate pyrophosphorylase